jgi:hypothetical protein
MAVSKNTRSSDSDTNKLFQTLFQNSQVSEEREREWREAVRHSGTGTPPLRFPVYEHLYSLNVYAQKLVDLLEEGSGRFAVNRETSLYHRSLIQYVRAAVSSDLSSPWQVSSIPTHGSLRVNGRSKRRTSAISMRSTFWSVTENGNGPNTVFPLASSFLTMRRLLDRGGHQGQRQKEEAGREPIRDRQARWMRSVAL